MSSDEPSLMRSSRRTGARSLSRRSFSRAGTSLASSALTADRLRPRQCCSTRTARFSASPTSSRTAIQFRTRSRCSRSCASRWKTKGAKLEVLGVGTTGYAKDILKDVLHADVALVETVAHTESALKFYDDPHVIVDVGGQDIKLIVLKDGRVKDFKLNTQCSAGNGYFLQSTAEGFGMKVEEFADHRLRRQVDACRSAMAALSSCSRTSSTSSVRAGERKRSSPGSRLCCRRTSSSTSRAFRIWPRSGSRFVLQGGTQNNLAVVKAEVDFIKSQLPRRTARSRRSSSMSTAANPERSARAWRRSVCGRTAGRPPLSVSMRCEHSLSHHAQ